MVRGAVALIPLEEARDRILAALAPVGVETVPLAAAAARVLGRPVHARLTQPPTAVSAMDGYGVRAADAATGARLRVIGHAPAGHPFAGAVGAGQAVRLFTGSVLPDGADAVLIQEDATAEDETILVREGVRPGQFVRARGLDFAVGEELLPAGRRLGARDIGLAAAGNHPWLTVHRRPRVAVLATGDEIALPGEPLAPGGIVSSNAHALAALVRAAGAEAVVLPIAPDDRAAIAEAAAAATGCDLLVTTGGASVGEHDLVQDALAPAGFALDFWQVAMRPGKPLIWGRLGAVPLLGLPGNPVSALVCGVVFLLPALRRLAGETDALPPVIPVRTATSLAANDRRHDHLRATLAPGADGIPVATVATRQDSSMLKVLTRADALVLRPPAAPAVPEGAVVQAIGLTGLGV